MYLSLVLKKSLFTFDMLSILYFYELLVIFPGPTIRGNRTQCKNCYQTVTELGDVSLGRSRTS